jgi:L-rhamnose isomerase
VARCFVWVKTPEEELANPAHFLAHVMTLGRPEDSKMLQGILVQDEFREVLERNKNAVAGYRKKNNWIWNGATRTLYATDME